MTGRTKTGRKNLHATALVAGETGVIVTGASGSGKSRLALEIIGSAGAAGRFAALVADDQVFLQPAGNRLLAVAPDATAGLVEIRGSAIVRVRFVPRAVMHLVVSIDAAADKPRLPDPGERVELAAGVSLPLLRLQPGYMANPLDLLDAFCENRLLA